MTRPVIFAIVAVLIIGVPTGNAELVCDMHFTSTAVEWSGGWYCGGGCSSCTCTYCCDSVSNTCCAYGNCF